jgi:RHS repeat-associated protein
VLEFDKDVSGGVPAGSSGSPLTVEDLSHRYLWQANAVDQLMADERTHLDSNSNVVTDEVLWALTDHLGTVRDLVSSDGATTSVVNHVVYDSFGNVVSQTDPSHASLFGFTGRPTDSTACLQNNLNRWYDVEIGKWVNKDPIQVDANRYRYCLNDPLSNMDPTGLDAVPYRGASGTITLEDGTTVNIR